MSTTVLMPPWPRRPEDRLMQVKCSATFIGKLVLVCLLVGMLAGHLLSTT